MLPAIAGAVRTFSALDDIGEMLTESAGALSEIDAALSRLTVDRRAMRDWLVAAAAEDAPDIAARSYWHPNRFAKIVLHADPRFRVRLHVWPPGERRRGESNPHGHRWNFASMVLAGGLATTRYAESADGAPHLRYRYVGRGQDSLHPEANIGLISTDEALVLSNERHRVDIATIHTVRPLGSGLVATLVLQGAALSDDTLVYGRPGIRVNEPGVGLGADEVRDLVRDVVAVLDAQPTGCR